MGFPQEKIPREPFKFNEEVPADYWTLWLQELVFIS
jgi:hypothetical protein